MGLCFTASSSSILGVTLSQQNIVPLKNNMQVNLNICRIFSNHNFFVSLSVWFSELFHRFKNISLEFPKRDALICFDGRRTTLWTYEDLLEASSIVGQFLEHCFDCDQTKTTKFIAIPFTDQDAIHIALSLGYVSS